MSYYYAREPGDEGQILTGNDASVGLYLSDLLHDGPMPVRAALELVSYLSDILTIAAEDQATHGDIRPGSIRIEETGTVSIEGWGEPRRVSRAPEGPSGRPSDVYGVGVVLYSCLSGTGLGALTNNREDHDAQIASRIARVDWKDLSDKRWMDEVLHFICGMLSFSASARPDPLDVANILGQVAQQAEGESLIAWAERVIEPLSRDEPKRPPPLAQEDEFLGGPEALAAPVSQTQAFSMRKAASAKGESTAFWSRDRIREMLAEEDEEEPVRARFEPARERPRGASTPPFQPAAIPPFPDATREGQPADLQQRRTPLPPPSRSVHDAPEPPLRPAMRTPPPAPTGPPPAATPPPPPNSSAPTLTPPPPTGAAPSPSVPPPATPASSSAPPPASYGALDSDGDAVPTQQINWKAVGVGLALLAFLCGGGGVVATGLFFWNMMGEDDAAMSASDATTTNRKALSSSPKRKAVQEPERGDTGEPAPKAKKRKTKPAPKQTKRTSRRTTTSKKSSTTRKPTPAKQATSARRSPKPAPAKTAPAPTPAPAPASSAPAATFPATVKWIHHGVETTLECSPGGRKVFAGTLRMQIEDVTTCRVKTETAMTAVQLRGGGTVTCSETGGRLGCTGPQ